MKWFQRYAPLYDGFYSWHASVGKNCSHMCAATACPGSILINLDADNFISAEFIQDILYGYLPGLLSGETSAIRWRHPNAPPCSGRTF